jgi:hypothetical protein
LTKLTDRLLTGSSLSLLAEKSLISKLKSNAGISYTSKMNLMLIDLESSRKEMDLYKKCKNKGKPENIEFNAYIVNFNWDIDKNKLSKLCLPNVLKTVFDDFSSFYLKNRSMHKLNLVYGLVRKNNNIRVL